MPSMIIQEHPHSHIVFNSVSFRDGKNTITRKVTGRVYTADNKPVM